MTSGLCIICKLWGCHDSRHQTLAAERSTLKLSGPGGLTLTLHREKTRSFARSAARLLNAANEASYLTLDGIYTGTLWQFQHPRQLVTATGRTRFLTRLQDEWADDQRDDASVFLFIENEDTAQEAARLLKEGCKAF